MEWISTLLAWLFPELVHKAGEKQVQERHLRTLMLLEECLESGEIMQATIMGEAEKEKASISYSGTYDIRLIVNDEEIRKSFNSIEELDSFLAANTNFRSGDFI